MLLNKETKQSLTNQLAERINTFFLSRTIFSGPFCQQPEQTSLTSTATDSTWNPFAEEDVAASFTHFQHTNQ